MSLVFAQSDLFALTGVLLLGLGLYAFITREAPIRRLIAFNVAGSGVFLMFGAATRAETGIDPVPQALIITSLVVAVAVTAFGIMLALPREAQDEGGREDSDAEDAA